MKYLLGYDIGSSSVKAALLETATGKTVASAFSPSNEMPIASPQPGFAEQEPEMWWKELVNATQLLKQKNSFKPDEVAAIGISYQMHGLVCVNKEGKVLRPSIIWCDSRAVEYGDKAFEKLGHDFSLKHLLNSPGNFTAAKLAWVKENEPKIFEQVDKIMLPGDYVAYRLTEKICTTDTGLSEGIFWDFTTQAVSGELLQHFGFDKKLLPEIVPVFSRQGELSKAAADLLGLKKGIPVAYRAGDQPNNAFSLNVLQPGELAATAGTSGVVYAVHNRPQYDPQSRVNTFVHVNNSPAQPRNGVLLCINGTGILNSWMRKQLGNYSYDEMNKLAATAPVGSDGLKWYPFGNGAERVLANKNLTAHVTGLEFNRHSNAHLLRAAQEGIIFALRYGIDVMRQMGLEVNTVRAGYANMFLSPLFRDVFAAVNQCSVELYNTDGALGAARGAGMGAGIYKNFKECFTGLEPLQSIHPQKDLQHAYENLYHHWKQQLAKLLS